MSEFAVEMSWTHFNTTSVMTLQQHDISLDTPCFVKVKFLYAQETYNMLISYNPPLRLWFLQPVSHPLKQELQQKEQQWRRRCEELQVQVQQLQEDREELQSRLKGNHAQEGMSQDLKVN